MNNMSVSHPMPDIEFRGCCSQPSGPLAGRSSVAVASGFLDASLRIWDQDQAQAKSRIRVAAAVLRGDPDDPPVCEMPTRRVLPRLIPWQVRNVQAFIDGSLDSKIRLQDCASRARLSPSYFSRAFKATFGTTVLDYIHRRRVERA